MSLSIFFISKRQKHVFVDHDFKSDGFSIIEGIVAALIVAIVTSGALSLYASYTKSLQINRRENQIQAAIAVDEAAILRANRRITCNDRTCSINPSSDPGEDNYYPDPSDEAAVNYFKCNICGYSDDPGTPCASELAEKVTQLIGSIEEPVDFKTLNIRRNAAIVEDHAGFPNESKFRYIVSWSRDNSNSDAPHLRELTLTPTVANWCP